MLEKLKHVNSQGETLDFLSLGIYINYNELRDFEWSAETENDLITKIKRGVVNKTIPFIFYCDEDEAVNIKNQFYEHFEKDVINLKPGYFEINEYRYYCYVTKNKKSNYLKSKRYLEIEVQITSDQPKWVKERTYSFIPKPNNAFITAENKTYPYVYEYTYGESDGIGEMIIDSLGESDFKIIVYGPVANPSIMIGEYLYNVDCDIGISEYLSIDSKTREIFITDISGNKINVFDKRNKENYIFQKIKPGNIPVIWSGGFGFGVIVFDERSEPKWI